VVGPDGGGGRRQDLRPADRARDPHPHGRAEQRGAHGDQCQRGPSGGVARRRRAMTQAPAISAGDTAWVLASSALVLLMTVGLACFYGGLVRSKNSLNTMMMSVVALGAVGVLWVLIGYSLAFAPGTAWIGGLAWVAFHNVGLEPNPAYAATIPQQAHAVFQA